MTLVTVREADAAMTHRRFPAVVVHRRTQRRLLCRDRQRRAKAGLCLFRRRAGAALGGEIIGAGRGETDRRQHCETAGAIRTPSDVGSAMKTSAADTQQSRRPSHRRLCLFSPTMPGAVSGVAGIIGAVGLEVKTWEKPSKSSQFDRESIRPRTFAFSTFL